MTRSVNRPLLALRPRSDYKIGVKLGRYVHVKRHALPLFLAAAWVCLAGASCEKKSSAQGSGENAAVVAALDKTTLEKESKEPQKDIEGVDLSQLDADQKKLYERLAASLVSPCGKAESLRRSATVSKDCKRSIFAMRYLAMLLIDGANEDQAREFYGKRYVDNDPVKLSVGESVPHSGAATAPVVIVEFMDYGCGACKTAKPVIEKVLANHPSDVVVYYKQYPLTRHHPDSKGAAQAALAAGKQGKYKEMHDMLFAKQSAHKMDDLLGYAKSIGLDMERFKADYKAAEAAVDADLKEGEEAQVRGTPTFFVNGRQYQDLYMPEYFANWIAEELAVNR